MDAFDPSTAIRRRVIYTGRVQGVGFRFTTRELAHQFPISGFVRNLPDGTVELEVEGAADVVDVFLASLAENFDGHIRDTRTTELTPRDQAAGFRIEY